MLTVQAATGQPLLPGETDLDQLWLIIKCLGSLCPTHQAHRCTLRARVAPPLSRTRPAHFPLF